MNNAWRIASEKILFEHARVSVRQQDVVLPSGTKVRDYIHIHTPSFISVFAVTAEGNVICEHQYKHGPGCEILTLVSGGIEAGETALDAAKRELLEETGYKGGTWIPLAKGVTYANARGSNFYSFLAMDCERITDPIPLDLEDIEVKCISYEQLMRNVASGNLPVASDGATILQALTKLDEIEKRSAISANRSRLRVP